MKESELKKSVMQLLKFYEGQGKLLAIRNNSFSGFIQRTDGYKSYINNSMKGMADVMVCFKGGTVEFWEFKGSGGKQSPDQKEFEIKIGLLGFRYYLITEFSQAERLINENLTRS